MLRFAMIAAAVLLSASPALAHESESAPPPPKRGPQEAPAQVISTTRGTMLVDLKGMTLYYFDRDDSGNKSNCDGKCAEKWLPLAADKNAAASGDFTVIVRSDGSRMWAYRYRPLYTSQSDQAPGDVYGFDPHWHVARPAF
jgi:predicted lipoprotein with Yx(FWY)xxD motif